MTYLARRRAGGAAGDVSDVGAPGRRTVTSGMPARRSMAPAGPVESAGAASAAGSESAPSAMPTGLDDPFGLHLVARARTPEELLADAVEEDGDGAAGPGGARVQRGGG